MKNIVIQLFIVCVMAFSVKAQPMSLPKEDIPDDYGYIVKIGQMVPDFEMELTDGSKIKMSSLRGKVVMLQFTASWCSVCRKEIPHIEKEIQLKHRDRNNFVLYGIDLDEPLDKVMDYKKQIKITYPLALDPGGRIFYTFAEKGAGVTRNIIIDKNGRIVYMTRLFKKEQFNEMKHVIDLLLKS